MIGIGAPNVARDLCPARWLGCVASSIETMAPQFSAQRMVREYADRFYRPAGAAIAR